MLRWLATLVLVLLLALTLFLPSTPLGRRGNEAVARTEVESAFTSVGRRLPELDLRRLDGGPLALADFRGKPLLLTFERSVDW